MELKNILARQPGPEVAEQLSIYQVRTGDMGTGLEAVGMVCGVGFPSNALAYAQVTARPPASLTAPHLPPPLQANLREKTKQMKAMASELNMYQAQVNEYKYEIERLVRELNEMKLVFFEQRKKEQADRARTLKASMYGPSLLDQLSGGSGIGSGGAVPGGLQPL